MTVAGGAPSAGVEESGDLFLSDERAALLLSLVAAATGGARDEVPVGAVLRDGHGRFLAVEANRSLEGSDPVGHAEMRAMARGAARLSNHRLTGATLTVSLEPCPMCRHAAAEARLVGVACAARREAPPPPLPAPIAAAAPALSGAAGDLLRFFFEQRREI